MSEDSPEYSDAKRRIAILPVDLAVLANVMRMPPGTMIEAISTDPYRPDRVLMRVRNPEFPPVRDGELLRDVDLIIHSDGRESEFL